MSKSEVYRTADLINDNDIELAAAACTSASLGCAGYSKLVGGLLSNASTLAAASGARVYQSIDKGTNWDIVSASEALAADTVQTFSVDIVGDFVQFVWRNGADAASGRAHLYLRP